MQILWLLFLLNQHVNKNRGSTAEMAMLLLLGKYDGEYLLGNELKCFLSDLDNYESFDIKTGFKVLRCIAVGIY